MKGAIPRHALLALLSLLVTSFPTMNAAPADQAHSSGYVKIGGRMVYFEEQGTGEHTIVLIHGFSLSSRMWDSQFRKFSGDYRVLRYDMTGYGSSSGSDTLVSLSDELALLMKKLEIRKGVIVGMSLGGSVATRFAIDHPQMVEAVITVGASLEGYQFSPPLRARLSTYPRVAKDSSLQQAKEAWLNDPFMTPITGSSSVKTMLREIITQWSGKQFTNPALWGFKRSNPPALERLSEISAPALVLVGEKDGLDMHAIADTIATRVPHAKRVVVPGAGHLLTMEEPERFNSIVLDFLSHNIKRR